VWCKYELELVPATRQSGEMLLGFQDDCFELGTWRKGRYFISADLYQRNCEIKWTCMLMYGLTDHFRSRYFLEELVLEVENYMFPIVIGSDFNLIIGANDQSNGNIYCPRVH
jgi:hypothetical protein